MKLDKYFFKYIVCDNDSERQDVIALCDLLGLNPYGNQKIQVDFEYAQDLLVCGSGTYQAATKSNLENLDMPAKEFIDTYFN